MLPFKCTLHTIAHIPIVVSLDHHPQTSAHLAKHQIPVTPQPWHPPLSLAQTAFSAVFYIWTVQPEEHGQAGSGWFRVAVPTI